MPSRREGCNKWRGWKNSNNLIDGGGGGVGIDGGGKMIQNVINGGLGV